MQGLLADVNVQGYVLYLRRLLEILDLWIVLSDLKLRIVTFRDLDLPRGLDDRSLWSRCQQDGWVLFTENRNNDGPDSLQATLAGSWQNGHLPVLTLSNKLKFEHSREYAERVASDVAELLFGIAHLQYRDQPLIYVPRSRI
jgi:hypothetical protein